MQSRAIEEAFAKLKLLKVFDFYETRVLTQEQQGWVQSEHCRTNGPDHRKPDWIADAPSPARRTSGSPNLPCRYHQSNPLAREKHSKYRR
jgi:hypothetical protein